VKMVTELREQFALQLLQENQWNYASAIAAFYRLRGNNKVRRTVFSFGVYMFM
jgi:TAP C-terminal domain